MNERPVAARPATELLPLPDSGRRFTAERTVRLGDVGPDGVLRLDAIGRYLQDVASDDALDSGLPNAMGWVVRRTMVRVERGAELNDRVSLTTFCTGAGRSWAERRTSITSDGEPVVDAVSLWVQIDIETGRPAKLGTEFTALYGEAAGNRVVSSKLSLPGPSPSADRRSWRFRRTDLDPFDHVNNAAQWSVLEELLAGRDRRGVAQLEYLAPVGLEEVDLLTDGDSAWLVVDGRVSSAMVWTPAL